MRRSTYELHAPVKILVFKGEDHFLKHLKKHFLSPVEPWPRFLGEEKISQWRKINEGRSVYIVEDAYRSIFSLLDKGIKFSAQKPIYISYKGTQKHRDGFTRKTAGYHFLAQEGFIATVDDNIVRTAYFVCTGPDESTYSCFRHGWEKLIDKASQSSYRDYEAGKDYFNMVFEKISPEHWNNCPDFRSEEECNTQTQGKDEPKSSAMEDAWKRALAKSAGKKVPS